MTMPQPATAAGAMRDPLANGEALERRRTRQKRAIFGVLFATGLLSGLYVGAHLGASGADFDAPWPPLAAALIAAAYLLSIAVGGYLLSRRTDEVERLGQYKAVAAAAAAYMVVYPTWFALWKGGFVAEPIHWILFLIFWLVLAGASLFYKVR